MSKLPRYFNEDDPNTDRIKYLYWILSAVSLVLLILVVGVIMNQWAERKAVFQNLVNELVETNTKIDIIFNEIKNKPDIINSKQLIPNK